MPSVPGSARARRRSTQTGEHVKHRRTRSGCYTCRNRRVKCDEMHPICERCRKGNRDCVYPEPSTSSKSSRSGTKSKSSPEENGSSGEEYDHDPKELLPPIPDDDEDGEGRLPDMYPLSRRSTTQSLREPSDTPSLTHDRSPSPSTEGSTTITVPTSRPSLSRSASMQAAKQAASNRPWPELPQDVKFYLNFHRTKMSHHHYCFKRDHEAFLKTTFLEIAVKNEPLLYAVVGFAAYYHTLTKPDGKLDNFLKYYNKSVSLLRQSILKNRKHGLATLLTILQLASIEELLGDWINLMGHQKAAFQILTKLYSPQTIMQSETLRKTLLWYIRFDLFVGFQSNHETVLGRDWFDACHDYYVQRLRDTPNDLTMKYEERFSYSRLLATDTAILFAKKGKGVVGDEDFAAQFAEITSRYENYEKDIDPALLDPNAFITDFSGAPPRNPEDPVDPYAPNNIRGGELWTTNYLLLDFWAIDLMFKLQTSMALRLPFSEETVARAYKTCQIFEAIELYPHSPPGALIEAQASFGIATLFLPKDNRHITWLRHKLAKIEASGYIYPATYRTRMTDDWGIDVTRWWFPNDEGCPPIVRSIKEFSHDRTTEPKDQISEDLRDMKGLFSSLSLGDSPDKPPSVSGLEAGSEISPTSMAGPMNLDEALIYTGGSPDFGWDIEAEGFEGGYGVQ
ncbi:hypothetical protein BU16DRAFT_471850 [Lophium mytilinum]|uniref:Zn(2)-C6 fungal-type domain-containing protein n=1 Tax=Lophium mytilinum TaxID=390894 RepID=A0A6A6QBJ3_9PEZI|nr:hypothetical protein BU16DRAFT_471850 [Lophium mytilinum]